MDSTKLHNVNIKGHCYNTVAKCWACQTFDEWRQFWKCKLDQLIENLSEMKNIMPFIDMFCEFILQVKKRG